MERFLARRNVERYRRLLERARDENERATLTKMLEEEEAKLRRLSDPDAEATASGLPRR